MGDYLFKTLASSYPTVMLSLIKSFLAKKKKKKANTLLVISGYHYDSLVSNCWVEAIALFVKMMLNSGF